MQDSIRLQPSSLDQRLVCFVDHKVGRNRFCPCGSGRKYKKCCLPKLSKFQAQITNYQSAYGPCEARSFYVINPHKPLQKGVSR